MPRFNMLPIKARPIVVCHSRSTGLGSHRRWLDAAVASILLVGTATALAAPGNHGPIVGIGSRASLAVGSRDSEATSDIQQADGRIVVSGWMAGDEFPESTQLPLSRLKANGTLDWTDGDASDRTITADLFDDKLAKTPEDFSLVLTTPTDGARLAGTAVTTSIKSTDGPGQLLFLFAEPGAALSLEETNRVVEVWAFRINGTKGSVSARYGVTDATASAGIDFDVKPGTLTWADGEGGAKIIKVKILVDDVALESRECFTILLSKPTGGAVIRRPYDRYPICIRANGRGFLLARCTVAVGEGDDSAALQVQRIGTPTGAASVNYATESGTATAGSDFTAATGTLEWADGDSAVKAFTVGITNDSVDELDETFRVMLSNPSMGMALGPCVATVSIVDNDAPTGGGGGGGGDLDPTFGIGGRVSLAVDSTDSEVTSVIQQADGRIVVAGWMEGGAFPESTQLLLMRFEANGTLDSSFGSGGIVTDTQPHETAAVVIQQRDGKLVVVGRNSDTERVVLWRFNADGTRDASFGTGGTASLDQPSLLSARGLVQQTNGRLVIAGTKGANGDTGQTDMVMARLNSDGTLNNSFGVGGSVTIHFARDAPDSGLSLVQQPDGKLVMTGNRAVAVVNSRGGTLAVARTTADGALDQTFGGDGVVEIQLDFLSLDGSFVTTWEHSVALQDDGKIVVSGGVGADGHLSGFVLRLEPDGSLDPTFGRNGIVLNLNAHGASIGVEMTAVAIQSNGRIVVSLDCFLWFGGCDMGLARFKPDGSADTTFGIEGTSIADFQDVFPYNSADAMTRQVDGNLLVVGSSTPGWPSTDPPRVIIARFAAEDRRSAGLIGFVSAKFEMSDNERPVILHVRRTGGSTGRVGATFETVDGSAMANVDYEAQSGRLEWADGDNSVRSIALQLIDDSSDPVEHFSVRLKDATGGAMFTSSVATVAITDTDTARPTIELLGGNPQIIARGDNYVELGATAMDDIDGDISASILIDTSAVDTSTTGTYQVTYNVTDSSGNAAFTRTRTVLVVQSALPPPPPPPQLISGGGGGSDALLSSLLLLSLVGTNRNRKRSLARFVEA